MGDDKQQTDDVGLSDDLELDSENADGVRGGALALDGVLGESKLSNPTLLLKEVKQAK
jgi:hypothetical protein